MDICLQEMEDAVAAKEFQKADMYKRQLAELRATVDEVNKDSGSEKVKITKDDVETVCRCLDILISMLQLPGIKTMSDSLRSCKDEFVMPLVTNKVSDIHWRVLKCIALFCIIDKPTAEETAKIICIPVSYLQFSVLKFLYLFVSNIITVFRLQCIEPYQIMISLL